MQKKLLTLIILVSLVFFSCWDFSLPNKIELEVEGSVDLPVRITTSDWGSVITKTLKKAFSGAMENGIGAEVYNVNDGQDVQAFCVYIPIKISDSLNPKDYLDGINLTRMDGSAMKINESVVVPSVNDFTLVYRPDISIPSLPEAPIPIGTLLDPIKTQMEVSSDFLHAKIKEGHFKINLDIYDGNDLLPENQFPSTYDITIKQENYTKDDIVGSYDGLKYTTGASDLASNKRDLVNQDINGSQIEIYGTITVNNTNPSAYSYLRGELRISLSLSEYKELDWDFRDISKELKTDPVSLARVAENMNLITFNKCDDDYTGLEPTEGIGINVNFTELSDELKLKMSVGCDDLAFDGNEKDIHLGNNVFGNKNNLPLNLSKYKNDANKLIFDITLTPVSGNKNVLHLTNLTAGETLKVQGEAKLFQHWVEAEVNIGDAFKRQFPDVGEKPINLSLLDDYFEGFKFIENKIEAAAYFSGPAIDNVGFSINVDAKYGGTSLPIIEATQFEQTQVVITDYLKKGIYIRKDLPDGGSPFKFVDIINARPDNLVFHFKINGDDTITITPDLFNGKNESVSKSITATIMLLLRLELEAGDKVDLTNGNKGGRIKFPEVFAGQKDLLGRKTLEENSKFTSLNVDYINYTVDFTNGFFTGAKLFIEKESNDKSKLLFPDGIRLDGSKIALNIMNKEFEFIKRHFIDPDLRLEFEKGRTVTVPKNIGVISVKIEAKGKNTIKLDF